MMIADAVVASAETPVAETTNRSRRPTGSLMAATYGQPGCREDSARRHDSEESRSRLPQRAADDAGLDDGGPSDRQCGRRARTESRGEPVAGQWNRHACRSVTPRLCSWLELVWRQIPRWHVVTPVTSGLTLS